MRVWIKRVGQPPVVEEIGNDLADMQKVVGGYIELVYNADRTITVCNEDGRLICLPVNCSLYGHTYVGDVLVTGMKSGDFADIKDAQIKRLEEELK